MTLISKYKHALLATALLAAPAPALAQNEAVNEQAEDVAEQANQLAQEANELTAAVGDEAAANAEDAADAARADGRDRDRDRDHDDDGGKWGLLGLLGLAGLLGLKRRDDADRDYRRTDTAARTGTDRDSRL